MECEKYSQQLELISTLEEDNTLFEEAIEHIKGCPRCQEKKLVNQQLDRAIKEEMRSTSPPPFLENRIVNRIRSSARPISREWRWGYILSGAVICLLLFVFYNQTQIISQLGKLQYSRQMGLPQDLLPSHHALLNLVATRSAKRHQKILSSRFVIFDDNLNDSFKNRFSFKIALPEFSRDIQLVGGSKCHSCNIEVAYLLYKTDSDSISLCVFSADNFGLANWNGKPTMFNKKDYNIAIWKKDGLVYAMVSQIPENEAKNIIWNSQE